MSYTVPMLSIVFMAVAALAGIVIPVALFLVFRRKYQADVLPFFIGFTVFIVFALLLEATVHRFILSSDAGKVIQNNIWLYGIYGGLMAGLFEEAGRYTAFKTVLKKKLGNNANTLMYGAGHGGFEAFFILVFSMVSNLVMALMLNAGMADKLTGGVTDSATLQALNAKFAALAGTAPLAFLMSVAERFAAVALHISNSVLVWFAVKENRFFLFPLAILQHALINAVAVILAGHASNVWMIEGVIYLLSAGFAVVAAAVWKKYASVGNITIKPDAESDE